MILVDSSFLDRYLDAANDYEKVTAFWNRYNPNPLDLLNSGQHWILRTRLFELMDFCKKLNGEAFNKIHKGHPYYFIGISSFLLSDFQTALYFFDAAFTEDANFDADPRGTAKPSILFLMMDDEVEGQAARSLAALAKAQVKRAIDYYLRCTLSSGEKLTLGIEEIRNDFIYPCLTTKDKPGLRTLATACISYFIEWDFRNQHFEYGVKQGTSEPFFSHLFQGCVLFESLLKHNPDFSSHGINLGQILKDQEILKRLMIDSIDNGKYELDDVYKKLNGNIDTLAIDKAIQITYMTRNTLGHSLGWDDKINQEQYQKLYFVIATACLHVIACLWHKEGLESKPGGIDDNFSG